MSTQAVETKAVTTEHSHSRIKHQQGKQLMGFMQRSAKAGTKAEVERDTPINCGEQQIGRHWSKANGGASRELPPGSRVPVSTRNRHQRYCAVCSRGVEGSSHHFFFRDHGHRQRNGE